MSFNKKLIALRREKNLTQEQLAGLIGISVSYVKKCERGISSPTIDILKKIAKVLGVSSDYLIFDNGDGVAEERLLDKDLLVLFEGISKLDKKDKESVKMILKSVIIRTEVDKLASKSQEKIES